MPNASDMCFDLLTLLNETLVLTTGRFKHLLGLLQAHGFFSRATRSALVGLTTFALREGLYPFDPTLTPARYIEDLIIREVMTYGICV